MHHSAFKNRRDFLKQVTGISAVAAISPGVVAAMPAVTNNGTNGKGYTFLFQGDSITDGNRTRNNDWNHVMGHGYQYIIACKWWYEYPQKGFHFFNRGVSGNKITDLAARWQTDTLDLKPDLLSILVGINDVAAYIGGNEIFTSAQYEKGYRELLDRTKNQLPAIRLVLCEPFVLPVGRVKENYHQYFAEVQKRQIIVKELATEYNAIHIPFQAAFDKALPHATADYWIWDGIHPMPAGHELMAVTWMQEVSRQLELGSL